MQKERATLSSRLPRFTGMNRRLPQRGQKFRWLPRFTGMNLAPERRPWP